MRFFDRLGQLVDRRWREHNLELAAFPRIAAGALEELPPARGASYDDVVEELFFGAERSQRDDGSFGQPPIVVYDSPRFYIEVLCWLDGTTSIHDHAFAGAFQVMAGSSIHSVYRFQGRRALHDDLVLGDLLLERAELLRAGDTRAIVPGPSLIHSLFHLDRPSVSVVVRTWGEQSQRDYLKPSVSLRAGMPAALKSIAERRRAALHSKASTDTPGYERLAVRIAAESDVLTLYDTLEDFCLRELRSSGTLDAAHGHPFLVAARERLGGDALAELLACIEESRWTADLLEQRATVQAAEHRAFLAMLLNLPDRGRILALAGAYASADGASTVDRWLRELTHSEGPGSARLLELQLERANLPGGVTVSALLLETLGQAARGATGAALVRQVATALRLEDAEVAADVLALEPALRQSSLRGLLTP